MKILYLFSGKKVTDKKLWSGTITRLYNTLKKENEVYSLSINLPFLDFIMKSLRIFFNKLKIKNEFLFLHKIKAKIITKKIAKYDFDYIFGPAVSCVLAYIKTNKPIVYLTDATYHLMDGYYYKNTSYQNKIFNLLESKAMSNASKIIVSSDWARNDIVEYYNCNVSKISVIPFYTEFNIVNDNIKNKKEQYEFLLVGVDWNRKGVQKAIDAVQYLNEFYKINVHLNIVGLQCPNEKSYSFCTFYGFLNKNNTNDLEKIDQLYKYSDVFIVPTIAECAGIVFAEACAYGLPILTHDTGGIGNYVLNDYNGYRLSMDSTYIDFAKKFKDIIDYNLLPVLSKNAHQLYNSTFTEKCWLEAYNQFIYNIKER